MSSKNQYVDFDGEIRIVGMQKKISAAEMKLRDEATAEAIRQYKEAQKRKTKSKKAS